MKAPDSLLEANRRRWNVLPAGHDRIPVKRFLELDDDSLRAYYLRCNRVAMELRDWEYRRYAERFRGREVLEIGSGLGCDGLVLSRHVKKWVFTDILPENTALLRRLVSVFDIPNAEVQYVEDIFGHDFGQTFDAFYAHGVLHHLPFEQARREVRHIDPYLRQGTYAVALMYPRDRWIQCGRPSFEEFGCMTDGEGTPWAEYYDEPKIRRLFGPAYRLVHTLPWGHGGSEFVNFELIKEGEWRSEP